MGVGGERGISPVVGTALMIAIVLIFSAVAGYVFFGLSDTNDPAPQVALEVESSDGLADWRLVHGGGEELRGANVELRGTATPNAAQGRNLSVDDEVEFYPTEQEVEVVWDGGDDTTYRLATFEVEQPLPAPDIHCDDLDETRDASGNVKVDGEVINCDIIGEKVVEVFDGGAIVGDINESDELDADAATVYGTARVEGVADVQDGIVTGSITSLSKLVNIDNSTVEGSIEAEKGVEMISDSVAKGDVVSRNKTAKVLDSTVEGEVTGEAVKLDGATVEGHVYVDPTNFDCTDSTVNGEDCDDYSPRDPADW